MKYYKCTNNNEFLFLQRYFGKKKIYLSRIKQIYLKSHVEREYHITPIEYNFKFPVYLQVDKDIVNKKVMAQYLSITYYEPIHKKDTIHINMLMREQKLKRILK